jgi:hypothetical protein
MLKNRIERSTRAMAQQYTAQCLAWQWTQRSGGRVKGDHRDLVPPFRSSIAMAWLKHSYSYATDSYLGTLSLPNVRAGVYGQIYGWVYRGLVVAFGGLNCVGLAAF